MNKNVPVIQYMLNNNFTCNMNNDFNEKQFIFKPFDHELSFNSIIFPNLKLRELKFFLVCNMILKYQKNPNIKQYSFDDLWFQSNIWNDFCILRKKYPQDIPIKNWIHELSEKYSHTEIHNFYDLIHTLNICCPIKLLKQKKYHNLYDDIYDIQLQTKMPKDVIYYALIIFKII